MPASVCLRGPSRVTANVSTMRLKVGSWIAGSGLLVAGLASVPLALGAPLVAWLCFIGGIVLAVSGAVHALRGPTPDERRTQEHDRTVTRNRLENERDDLAARRQGIDADLAVKTSGCASRPNMATPCAPTPSRPRSRNLTQSVTASTADFRRLRAS